jgi:UDP-glucose 4-epimerase
LNCVVTGGAGFIGSHLVDRLITQGLRPRILDNLSRLSHDFSQHTSQVDFIHSDIRDYSDVKRCFHNTHVVFHLAAQSHVVAAEEDPQYTQETTVEGTRNVLRAALECDVQRVIFTSSREVYGDPSGIPVHEDHPLRPKNVYGRSKLAGEEICNEFRARGLRISILRLANVYGLRAKTGVIPLFTRTALEHRPLSLFGGSQVLDFIWVGTVVDALLCAAFDPSPPEVFNVGSGRGTTIAELAAHIIRLAGSSSPVVTMPQRQVDVTRFVAGTNLLRSVLDGPKLEDNLAHLPDLIRVAKNGRGTHDGKPLVNS